MNFYVLIISGEPSLTLFVHHKKKFYHFFFVDLSSQFELLMQEFIGVFLGGERREKKKKRISMHRSYKRLPRKCPAQTGRERKGR